MVEAEGLVAEDGRVHDLEVGGDARGEVHQIEHLGLQVDAGGDLDQFEAVGGQLEDRAFGHEPDRLAFGAGEIAREGDLLDGGGGFLRR